MKTIPASVIVFALALLAPQIVRAQGTMTVLSNLNQTAAGSLAVGSDSWLATLFRTGSNPGGYVLDSVELGMADASGNPSNFMVMIYSMQSPGIAPGVDLGTQVGSLNPVTGGIYTYTPASSIILSPNKYYYIVLTAGTAIADGAYDWSYTSANSYNPNGNWSGLGGIQTSSDGSYWPGGYSGNPQYAIEAIPVPEPGVWGLVGLGGLAFLCHRRKSKAVS